jgi:hypothetical protein
MKSTMCPWLAAATIVALVAGTLSVPAGPVGSLTNKEIESSETKTALNALVVENAELQAKLAQSDASVLSLQKNLATANAEAEVLKRKVTELMLRLEALGLDAASNPARLEQRLLKAVNDLRLTEEERKLLKGALIELSEAVLRFQSVAVTNDGEARQVLEAAMRQASKSLGVSSPDAAEAPPVAATLTDGLVIAVKEDLALVVTNLGRVHGVKTGMPFTVLRADQEVGTVRIVDVRDRIAGAVIQDLSSDTNKIKVGDRLKVGAER